MSDNFDDLMKERNLLIWKQNELAERRMEQEAEWRRQEEERRAAEEEKRRVQAEYENARPVCLYCGEKIDYSTGSACYEYCCKKCAVADLGRDNVEDYMDHVGNYNLSRKLDSLIAAQRNLEALLLSEGMDGYTVEQNIYLAKLHVISCNLNKAATCLQFVLNTLAPAEKGNFITSLYQDDRKQREYNENGVYLGSYLLKGLLNSGENFIGAMTPESQISLGVALLRNERRSDNLNDDERTQMITEALESGFYSLDDLDRQKEVALVLLDEERYKNGYRYSLPFLSAILNVDDQDGRFNQKIKKSLASLSIDTVKEGRKTCQNGLLAAFLDAEIDFYRATLAKCWDAKIKEVRMSAIGGALKSALIAPVLGFFAAGALINEHLVLGILLGVGAFVAFCFFLTYLFDGTPGALKKCMRNGELYWSEDGECNGKIREIINELIEARRKRATSF